MFYKHPYDISAERNLIFNKRHSYICHEYMHKIHDTMEAMNCLYYILNDRRHLLQTEISRKVDRNEEQELLSHLDNLIGDYDNQFE